MMGSLLLLQTTFFGLLFANADWIDPDTPEEAFGVGSYMPEFVGVQFDLVMSDEFNVPGRTFRDGEDPMWTALNKNDFTNDALHYYDHNNIQTNEDGELEILTEAADTKFIAWDDAAMRNTHVEKHFKSGMLQSWNKFCFQGGIIEAEVTLPGNSDVSGLWPAFWLLGNLSRHTYVQSTENLWPWSRPTCDEDQRDAQLLSGCRSVDHYGMDPSVGRGSPEVDIFEVQAGKIKRNQKQFLEMNVGQPFMSASYQVAPARILRPGPSYWPGPNQWYSGIEQGPDTCMNILFYGNYNFFRDEYSSKQEYWSDALSWNRQLESLHFEVPHTYRLEWGLPSDDPNATGGIESGFLNWYLDGELVLSIKGESLTKDTGATIPFEPMYIIMNTAISKQWGFDNEKCVQGCPCLNFDCNSEYAADFCGFPEEFCTMVKEKPLYKVDHVRVYQNMGDERQKVGCSTPERPTRRFIEENEEKYKLQHDEKPLKDIQNGTGSCLLSNSLNADDGAEISENFDYLLECGGPTRGICEKEKCNCNDGYTGPHCLAHDGSDPIAYDEPTTIADVGYYGPMYFSAFFVVGTFAIASMLFSLVLGRKRVDGWVPIPDLPGV